MPSSHRTDPQRPFSIRILWMRGSSAEQMLRSRRRNRGTIYNPPSARDQSAAFREISCRGSVRGEMALILLEMRTMPAIVDGTRARTESE